MPNAMTGASRTRWMLASVSLVSLAAFTAFHWARFTAHQPVFLFPDYLVFWSSGPAVARGGLAQLFDVNAFTALQNELFAAVLPRRITARPWLYPPTFLLITTAFSALPYFASALLFQVGGAGALWLATGRRWWPWLALIASPAFGSIIDAGQISAWIAACIVGGVLLLDTSPIAAGLLFAVVSLKPHLFVLLPLALLSARTWRALASCVAGAALLVVLSLAMYGIGAWQLWLSAATGPAQLVSGGNNILATYGIQMGSVLSAVRMLGGSGALAWGAQLLAMLVAAIAVYRVFARTSDVVQRALTLTLAALLFAPYWMNYDLVLPCAAITVAATAALRHGFRDGESLTWLVLWLLPYAMLFVQVLWHVPIAPFIVLAALLFTARTTVRDSLSSSDESAVTSRASSATLHAAMAASHT